MRLRYHAGVAALALLAGSTALSFEPAVLRDLVIESGGQRISVGAVKVPLWSAAFAQSADSFSLDNVTFTFGVTTYEMKRIEFSGVSTPRAEIEALFSSASSEPMESRLRRINAKQITIPEARVKQVMGKETQTTTYRNTVVSDVSQGRIASVAIETMAMESSGTKDKVVVTGGRTTMSEVDLPAMARLYEAKSDGPSTPMAKIYGAFSLENLQLVDSREGITFKIARLGGRDFLGRPTKDSWNGTVTLMTEMSDRTDLSAEDQARLLPAIADLIDSFQIGFMEASGIEMTTKAKGSSGQARIARIAYTGGTDAQPADMRWEGFEFSDKDNRMKLDSLSLTGFSFRQTLDGLRNLQAKSFDDLDAATMRSLVPTLGTLRLSGFSIDGTTEDEGKKVKVQAALKGFELTADKPVNAIPTNLRIGLQNLTMTLPSKSTDDGVKELTALGYKNIDVSFLAAAIWNESAKEIALKEVSVQGQDMGSLSLTGTIGNVTQDLFSADEATAAAALIGAKAKSADIVVEDKGLLGRYLIQAAKEQKTTPEALRTIYASAAPFVVSSMIGNSEQASTLGQAIGRFIAKPGKLTLNAQPKNPSGFGVMDAMLASDPKEALAKLNISAKVE
ncbi:hypothetical protein [Microvirga soli]|uniref:hypothetical protein n=1 Tax=Microvirga soli TaxID=1854496 RepID=UPI00191E76AC|nr:hypothetical protein [Microvirga soli]